MLYLRMNAQNWLYISRISIVVVTHQFCLTCYGPFPFFKDIFILNCLYKDNKLKNKKYHKCEAVGIVSKSIGKLA